jgi:hypothetical protein
MNLDVLSQELGVRCKQIFDQAACAPSRSSIVNFGNPSPPLRQTVEHKSSDHQIRIRERIVGSSQVPCGFCGTLVTDMLTIHSTWLYLARTTTRPVVSAYLVAIVGFLSY